MSFSPCYTFKLSPMSKKGKRLSGGWALGAVTPGGPSDDAENVAIFANDDQEERRRTKANKQRRQRLSLFSASKANKPRSDDSDEDGAVVEHVYKMASATPGTKKVQMGAMLQNVMKMHVENKINKENAWNLNLVDNFKAAVQAEDGKLTNFQAAAGTLEATMNIYSHRVDSVGDETMKVWGRMRRGAKGPDHKGTEEDGDGADGDEDGEDGEGSKKKKRVARRGGKSAVTLETNADNVNLKDMDGELNFAVDPLFEKTSAAFDQGGANGLLLNTLSVFNGCDLIFDSTDALEAAAGSANALAEDIAVCDAAEIASVLGRAGNIDVRSLVISQTLTDFIQHMEAGGDDAYDPCDASSGAAANTQALEMMVQQSTACAGAPSLFPFSSFNHAAGAAEAHDDYDSDCDAGGGDFDEPDDCDDAAEGGGGGGAGDGEGTNNDFAGGAAAGDDFDLGMAVTMLDVAKEARRNSLVNATADHMDDLAEGGEGDDGCGEPGDEHAVYHGEGIDTGVKGSSAAAVAAVAGGVQAGGAGTLLPSAIVANAGSGSAAGMGVSKATWLGCGHWKTMSEAPQRRSGRKDTSSSLGGGDDTAAAADSAEGQEGGGGGGSNKGPSVSDIKKMKVADLRSALSDAGLEKGGLKPDLIQRLIAHIHPKSKAGKPGGLTSGGSKAAQATIDFARPAALSAKDFSDAHARDTNLSGAVISSTGARQTTLPPDMKLTADSIGTLFTNPKLTVKYCNGAAGSGQKGGGGGGEAMVVINGSRNTVTGAGDVGGTEEGQAGGAAGGDCGDIIIDAGGNTVQDAAGGDDSFDMGDVGGFDDDDDDDRRDPFTSTTGDDLAAAAADSNTQMVTDADGNTTLMVAAPAKVERVAINYARVGKRVNMGRLKTGMWKSFQDARTDMSVAEKDEAGIVASAHPAGAKARAAAKSDEGITFRSMIDSLPAYNNTSDLSEVSISYCFLSVLFLANEQGLNLDTQVPDISERAFRDEGKFGNFKVSKMDWNPQV